VPAPRIISPTLPQRVIVASMPLLIVLARTVMTVAFAADGAWRHHWMA
jgi:hypothetical protein